MTKENHSTGADVSLVLAHLILWSMLLFGLGHLVGMLAGQEISDATEQRLAAQTKEFQENAARAATWAYELERRPTP